MNPPELLEREAEHTSHPLWRCVRKQVSAVVVYATVPKFGQGRERNIEEEEQR